MQFTIASEEIDKYYGYVFTLNNVLEIELINKDGKFKKIFHTFNIENINNNDPNWTNLKIKAALLSKTLNEKTKDE